jgi:predicted DNA-binding transcriptional regulator AlpA
MRNSISNAEFITGSQLRARYGGKSRMWLHRALTKGFPAPVYLGTGVRHWRIADVLKWERATIAKGFDRTVQRPTIPNRNRARRRAA